MHWPAFILADLVKLVVGNNWYEDCARFVTEVEMIVNSRPLSYLSTDNIQESITPSHLLTGHRVMSLPDGPYNKELADDISVKVADIIKE